VPAEGAEQADGVTPARGVQIERSLPGAGNFKPLYGRLEVPGDLHE
jgi:hypothetical protein